MVGPNAFQVPVLYIRNLSSRTTYKHTMRNTGEYLHNSSDEDFELKRKTFCCKIYTLAVINISPFISQNKFRLTSVQLCWSIAITCVKFIISYLAY